MPSGCGAASSATMITRSLHGPRDCWGRRRSGLTTPAATHGRGHCALKARRLKAEHDIAARESWTTLQLMQGPGDVREPAAGDRPYISRSPRRSQPRSSTFRLEQFSQLSRAPNSGEGSTPAAAVHCASPGQSSRTRRRLLHL